MITDGGGALRKVAQAAIEAGSRFMPQTRGRTGLVLVLGGGGHRGAAQVGVLRSLLEHGVRPDALVGSSVGALNAAVLAAQPGLQGLETLERIWTTPEAAAIFRDSRLRLIGNWLRGEDHLREGGELVRLLIRACEMTGVHTFEELRLPLRIVVTDIAGGQRRVFEKGDLIAPLLASASVPGVYPPVEIGGRLYCDGGVADNTSLGTAAAFHPRAVVAVDLMGGGGPLNRNWRGMVDRAVEVMLHQRMLAEFEALRAHLDITLICPSGDFATREFGRLALVAQAARRATDLLLEGGVLDRSRLRPGLYYAPVELAG